MIRWNKVTWYSQISAIILGIAIFYLGFYLGSAKDTPTALEEIRTENEFPRTSTARLGHDGREIKFATSEILNTRNFIFYEKGNDNYKILEIFNPNIEVPQYRIVQGNKRDWLVVTRIEGSGSGYIKRVDDWYAIFGHPKKVLSYISQQVLSPGFGGSVENISEYIDAEVFKISPDDSGVDVKVINKICSITPDGDDKDCTESSEVVRYAWDEDKSEFILQEEPIQKELDVSKYESIMPVSIGKQWIYEGKRLFYDRDTQEDREVVATKVVEITDIEQTKEGLKIHTKETYKNEPDFSDKTNTYLVSTSGFDFGMGKIIKFPLTLNQRITEPEEGFERDDGLYYAYVSKVHSQNVLGNEYKCYDITDSTLGDTSFDTFCEGLGYVRDYYEHHGTPNEADYKLVGVN